ncbi:MAG: exodeoxyribonuclease V subunit beta [Methylotetracoccus sp.]
MTAAARPLDSTSIPLTGVHLIEASAGTGKTYAIANLFLRLLLQQRRAVGEILVVTFTKAATAELRARIRRRLRDALGVLDDPTAGTADPSLGAVLAGIADPASARRTLVDALACMDEAAIMTIHGLCQRLLQEHALASGVPFDAEFSADAWRLQLEAIEDFWRDRFYFGSSGLAALAQGRWQTPELLLAEIRAFLDRDDALLSGEPPADEVSPARYRELVESVRTLWRSRGDHVVEALLDLVSRRLLSRAQDRYRPEDLEALRANLTAFVDGPIDDYAVPKGYELLTTHRFELAITAQGRKTGIERPEPALFDAFDQIDLLRRAKLVQLRADAIRQVRSATERIKRDRRLLAYDDLIRGVRTALQGPHGASFAATIAGKFPAALIDEFQDTDPGQYAIFAGVYAERPDCGLFMIGDPKQAIYGFRGGDIFTYIRARRAAPNLYTMNDNWRSAASYVRAVNTLFDQSRRPFVYADDIPYHHIDAAAENPANREPLRIAGRTPAPFCVWYLTPENTGTTAKVVGKGHARTLLAAACCAEIARLLDPATGSVLGSEPLRPRDIAILVRTHGEAEIVQNRLVESGIPSVYLGRDSVIMTPDAEELARVLAAVADPGNERALRSALATEMLGVNADWLAVDTNARWDEVFATFSAYHEQWLSLGFIAMFRSLLHRQGVPERLIALRGGERRLTNLLQLGELLQSASSEHPGIEPLLQWFGDQRAQPEPDIEEQQLRLESDAERVQIVTIHKSKGLEYPVVFAPFCWDGREAGGSAPFGFHDESDPGLPYLVDLAASAGNVATADRERLAEDARLLYVAVTRARHRCYLAWGEINGTNQSALTYLLRGDAASRPMDLLQGLNRDEPLFEIAAPPLRPDQPVARSASDESPLNARPFHGRIDTSWRTTSFTALATGVAAPLPNDLMDPGSEPTPGDVPRDDESAAPPDAIFLLPKGARTGILLHEIFESLEFPDAAGATLTNHVEAALHRHGFDPEPWTQVIAAMIGNVLDTVIDRSSGLSLRRIPGTRRLNELQFHFPIRDLDLGALRAFVSGAGIDPVRERGPDIPRLRGLMQGFIDLVFEFDGRHYLADYKSNHLGDHVEDYRRERLDPVMQAHHYDLQYLIYSVALHRYLGRRVPRYRYREHFGGVFYLFIRGMRSEGGGDSGVFFERPDEADIARLDALFGETP